MEEHNQHKLRRLVLVDDEPSVLTALKVLLEAVGFSVYDFKDASRALDHVREGHPCDLFLCDLKMPNMSGLDALQALQAIQPNIPFILFSGHATNEEFKAARQLGAAATLSKPFTLDDFNAVLQQLGDNQAVGNGSA